MRAPILGLGLLIACGGGKKPPAGPTEGDDCEAGRCLADISALVEQHRPAARACYEAGHQRDATLQGRVVINFVIDPTGAVVDASQSAQDEQITDDEVIHCITDVILRIPFAASAAGKTTKAFHRYEFNPPKS